MKFINIDDQIKFVTELRRLLVLNLVPLPILFQSYFRFLIYRSWKLCISESRINLDFSLKLQLHETFF